MTPPPSPPPENQITYEAKVTVPAWATCLMSALESAQPGAAGPGKRTFSWKQSVPMPSYLIAVAVGELESREISPRWGLCVCALYPDGLKWRHPLKMSCRHIAHALFTGY